jgi:hypothetical protein
MARSILFSVMFIAGALGVVIFSAAQFTDAEDTTSNVVQAGTVDLVTNSAYTCTYAGHGLEGALDGGGVGGGSTATADCVFTVRHNGSLPNTNLYAMISFEHYACDDTDGPGLNDSSQYCDSTGQANGGANLTESQFLVTNASLTGGSGYTTHTAFTGPADANVELNAYLASCSRIITSMPVNETITGSFTVELQQDRTSNWMQGDAIDITIHFELAEFGAENIDCVLDTASAVTPPAAP